jgi:colanic acid biosynthesis glycosyl transferase WcaI
VSIEQACDGSHAQRGKVVNKSRSGVIFTEQFYYPEGGGMAQLPRDITTYLARHGCSVEVVCGSEQYAAVEGQAVDDPRESGVKIRRVPRLFRGDIHRKKLLRQLWFCLAATPLLLLRRRPQVFVTQTNPPFIVPLVAAVAACHRRPLIVIAQDLYPEVLIAHGMLRDGSMGARVLQLIFKWAYRRAACVVSLGPVMHRRLVEKGVRNARITTISNWATGDEGIVRGGANRLWGLEGCFVVLYSGNAGVAHDVETPIRALGEVLTELPTLRLVFVGKGSRLADAAQIAREAGVSHAVQFRPLVTFDLLPHSLGLADIALVTLRKGFEGLVVPSKLLGSMARGVPTLYVGPPSDAQEFIEASAGGLCVPNGDMLGLANVLRRLATNREILLRMGVAAASFYRDNLARPIALQRYLAVVENVGRLSSSTGRSASGL